MQRLAAAHDPLFVVPLGLKAWFADNGITRVEELRLVAAATSIGGVTFVCVPAQHFSQRTLWDSNRAALGVVGGARPRAGGSTSAATPATSPASRRSGARLGPFDLAAIAIGAYHAARRSCAPCT